MMVKSFRMKALIAGGAVAAAVSAGAVSDVPAAKVLQSTAAMRRKRCFLKIMEHLAFCQEDMMYKRWRLPCLTGHAKAGSPEIQTGR